MPEIDFHRVGTRFVALIVVIVMLLTLLPAGATAAVSYTGSVVTTDVTGTPQDVFARGEPVYSNVELKYQDLPYDGTIRVELRRTTDGAIVSSFNSRSNNPVVGWNNGSASGLSLSTAAFFIGDVMTYNVIAYYTGGGFNDIIGQTTIVVRMIGLTLNPISGPYYPDESIAIRLGLNSAQTSSVFYIQVVNETGVTWYNWTAQVALTGIWRTDWLIPSDFPDGSFEVNVRDAASHVIWYQTHISVQKFALFVSQNRQTYLTGETAEIYYMVLDTATWTPISGVTIEYQAHWLNRSGSDVWAAGSLPGAEGDQLFAIPFDTALYADVSIVYWANETSSGRSYEYDIVLTLGELNTYLEVSANSFSPGDNVAVEVIASVENTALQGAAVDISVELEGVILPAYGVNGLLTGEGGHATHTFTLSSDAAAGTYIVNATVAKAGHVSHLMSVFNVFAQAELIVEFDKSTYYSGDTAQVRLEVVRNGLVVAGQSVTYIIVTNMTTIALTGQNSSGAIIYPIPSDFFGTLAIEAVSNLDGEVLSGFSMCAVIVGELKLSAERPEYSPGDRITFDFEIMTNLASGSINWEITDANGVRVANGSPTFAKTGAFYYDTPTIWCSDSYTATVSFEPFPGEYMDASQSVTKAIVPPLALLPFLRVDNPLEGSVTSVPVVKANGSTEANILLTVNGYTVLTTDTGVFSLNLPLLEGANLITIIADNFMGTTTITRNVTFANPIPGIESQLSQIASDLADSMESITVIWSQLNATEGDLTELWSQANATSSGLSAAWAEVNASTIALDALESRVDDLRAELIDVHDTTNSTDAGLLALQQSLDAMDAQLESTRSSLNATVAELSAAQTQLDSVQADLDDAQKEIAGKATKSSVSLWFVVAVVISIVLVAAMFLALRRKE